MTSVSADAPARARSPVGWGLISALSFAGAVLLLGGALATSRRPASAVLWGGLAFAAYAFGLLCLIRASRGRGLAFARWRFAPWSLLWYAVAYGVATVTWSQPQIGAPGQIAVSNVLRALWLMGAATTVWTLGYLIGPGHPLRGVASRAVAALGRRYASEVRSLAAPWILYAIGFAARVASTATSGRFGYVGDASSAVSTASGYGQILNALTLLAPLAVAAAAVQVFGERLPGARVTLATLFLVELAIGAASGGKQSFVIALLAVAVPFSAARRRLPKITLAVLTLAFLVVVIPFNQAYRHAARGASSTLSATQAIGAAPGILQHTVTGNNLISVIPHSVTYLFQRIREIDSPAIILQRSPTEIDYRPPLELVAAPIAAVVPRAIWPGKPILATGYEFGQEYYGLPSTIYSSSAITPAGDLYRHGGWIPVIAGMFLLGCGVRLLDDVLDIRANPHAIFLVLLLFPSVVKGEQDWITLLAGIPATVAVWVLAVLLTFRPKLAA